MILFIGTLYLWAGAPPTVPVGDAGNAMDTTGFGAADYPYRIGVFEVTRAEYADFLNAVAAADPHGLYNPNMSITRSGSAGNYSYVAVDGTRPVAWVSWYDAVRFVNWLHNGQPSGEQGTAATEDGAYTFSGETTVSERNPDAQVFLPNENEWYKAAYYQGGSNARYWAFPTRSDAPPTASLPAGAGNTANYDQAVNQTTAVGAYSATQGYYGTLDQAGNLWEWNETLIDGDRGIRGGSYKDYALLLRSSYRDSQDPSEENEFVGIRIASSSVNHAPVAAADSYAVNEASTLVVQAPGVLGNDVDSDGNMLSAILVAGPAHGVLTLSANGAFSYKPAGNYAGADSFSYKPNDGLTDGSMVTVTVTVKPVYYTVTVVNGSGSGSYRFAAVVPVQANVAPPGQVFDRWTGDIVNLANAASSSTSLTVPSSAITVTASYKNIQVSTVMLTLAEWKSRTQYLTIQGKGPAGKTVVLYASTGTKLGTSTIRSDGTWIFQKKFSSRKVPPGVRATCNNVTVAMPVTRR